MGPTMEDMIRIEEKVDNLHEDLHDLKKILLGNKMIVNDSGMIGKILDQEKRIGRLERFKDRVIYVLVGASLFGGYALSDILNKFFKH